jgi:large subunit ribosomal protein L13
MKTVTPKPDQIKQDWYIVDASDQILGRLATKVAAILRGKNKPYFSPHLDTGDYVVVINAEKIKLSGNKELQKTYKRYSGYPSGLKEIPFKRMLAEKPEEIIRHAVKGMLPKNALGRKLIRKLKIYVGEEHPHTAQKPKNISLSS